MLNEPKNKYEIDDYNSNIHENINGKFEFQFGVIWTLFMTFMTIILLIGGSSIDLNVIIIFLVFWYVGIVMLKNGLKKMKADRKTEEFGEECYGRVYKISSIGSSNGNSYYKAEIAVYIPSEGITKIIGEDVGYDYGKFPEDAYLKLLYYENDVNIKQVVEDNYIPEQIKSSINQLIDDKLEEDKLEENELEKNGIDEMEIHNYKSNSNVNKNGGTASAITSIIFGMIWLLLTEICTWGFYGIEGGTIFVNGEQVSREEFNAMLWPKLFFGIFWVVGIAFILSGIITFIKSLSRNSYKDDYSNFEKNSTNYQIDEEYDDDPIKKI